MLGLTLQVGREAGATEAVLARRVHVVPVLAQHLDDGAVGRHFHLVAGGLESDAEGLVDGAVRRGALGGKGQGEWMVT